jgi:putative ABC transport system permease protein
MLTVGEVVSASIADRRFIAVATSAFAVIALLLTVAGLYGVMALGAAERSRELGIRVALGATRRAIVGMLVRQGIAPVAAGILLGGLAAAWGMRFIASFLFGIQQLELDVLAAVAALVMAGGLAACVFPARLAARVDPVQVLKSE